MRALRWARLLPAVDLTPTEVAAAGAAPVLDTYALAAMSAWGRFPWVYRCATVIAQDVSSLPLYVVRWTPEPDGHDGPGRSTTTYRHPALDLLHRPAPGVTGSALRRQLAVDLVVAGNAYVRRVSIRGRAALVRLHPHAVSPIVDPANGVIVGYDVRALTGVAERVTSSQIAHIRGPSWSDAYDQAIGYPATHALDTTLRTEEAASRQARISAQRGRLEMLLTPTGTETYGAEAIQRLKSSYDEAAKRGDGAYFVGHGITATPLTGTARDAQSIEHREANRIDVCGAYGVPPTIAGLPGANHGTAREEARGYWERTVRPIGLLIEEGLTALLLPASTTERIEHDYSGVVALQVARADQLSQAVVLVRDLGATPRAALDYMGFDDAPAGQAPGAVSAVRPGRDPSEEPRDEVFVASLLARLAGRPATATRAVLAALGHDGPVADEAAHAIASIPLDVAPDVRVALTQAVSRSLTASREAAADA